MNLIKKLLSWFPTIGWILYLFLFKEIQPLFNDLDKYKDEKDIIFFLWHSYWLFFIFFII